MTQEELKEHCEKQIESCEMWAKHKGEEPHGNIYEEHKLILELLEQEPRKGKWTKISNTVPCMNCPICGSTFTLIQGGNKMHYCPNCGAKMSEE